MVTSLVVYQCDICKKKYNNLNEAEQCESKGVEKATYRIGEMYDFVTSYILGNDFQDEYVGIETIRIKEIVEAHTCVYICEVWDELEKCWYTDTYEIEGNKYFEVWNRGKIENL